MFAAIKRFFSGLLRKLWRTLKSIVSGALEVFLAEFLEYGKDVVKGLVNSDLTSEGKRRLAFDTIKQETIKKGFEIRSSWINILIEIALATVKKEFNL